MTMSGLALAEAIRDRTFPTPLPPWVERMEVHKENLVDLVERGRVASIWTPGRQFTVPDGYVQGGLLAALADGGQALALLTTQEMIEPWVTIDLHIRFVRPIKAGETVRIESRVVSRTGASAIIETTFTLVEERMAAIATGGWRSAAGRRAAPGAT